MSLVLQLLARYWYVPVAMAIAGAGVYTLDSTSYARLQTTFASYKAEVAQAESAAQKAAREALQAQIDARQKVEAKNAKILSDLNDAQTKAAAAERDRAFAERLLQAVRAAGTAGHAVPAARHQPGTAPAPSDDGHRSAPELPQLTAAAAGECREAIAHYRALQAQLKPQL